MVDIQSTETTFVESLQGFASFCEACIRDGKMRPDDMELVIGKLRDAAFVVDQLTKHRDDLRVNYRSARALALEIEAAKVHLEECRADASINLDDIEGLKAELHHLEGEFFKTGVTSEHDI